MPSRWPAEVFDYDGNKVAHDDFHSVDLEKGKWFKCKFCTNPLNAENKFTCRPFAAQELLGAAKAPQL